MPNPKPDCVDVVGCALLILLSAGMFAVLVAIAVDGFNNANLSKDCRDNCCPPFCANSTDTPGCLLACLDECDTNERREVICRSRPEPQDE